VLSSKLKSLTTLRQCQSLPTFSWGPQQAQICSISVLLPSPARSVASWGQNELQNIRAMKSWELYQLHKVTSAIQDKMRGKRVPSGIPVFLAVVIEFLFGKCIIIYKTPVFSCLTSSQLFLFPTCFFAQWYVFNFPWCLHAVFGNKPRYQHTISLPPISSIPTEFPPSSLHILPPRSSLFAHRQTNLTPYLSFCCSDKHSISSILATVGQDL